MDWTTTTDKGQAMMDNGARTPGNAGKLAMAHARTLTIIFMEAYGLAAEVEVEEDGERGRHRGWFNITTTRGIDLLQHRGYDKGIHSTTASGHRRYLESGAMQHFSPQ